MEMFSLPSENWHLYLPFTPSCSCWTCATWADAGGWVSISFSKPSCHPVSNDAVPPTLSGHGPRKRRR